jgi:ESS family glutamate:Na+ symporter
LANLVVLHVVILIGLALHDLIGLTGLKLPAFVPCMLGAIAIGNLLPVVVPRYPAVSRTPALSLISEVALGTFLAISLMSMQLWALQGLGVLMLLTLAAQTLAAVAFILFLVFRFMGGGYRAAVLSSGFAGFSLGATPTAIANMNAVTKRYGPSPVAFVILPLVSAFFVDLVNAAAIQLFLAI